MGCLCLISTICFANPVLEQEKTIRRNLSEANKLMQAGKCQQVLKTIGSLDSVEIFEDENAYVDTYKLLAICRFQLKDREGAERALTRLLILRNDAELDPYFASPELLVAYERLKKEFREKSAEMKKIRGEVILDPTLQLQKNASPWLSRVVAFAPFGIPQFLNGHKVKGTLISLGQIAFLGANVGAYWWKQGVGTSAVADGGALEQYRTAQAIQFASIGLFAAVYIYSVVDALLD
jgi:hypothetical protein